MDEVQVQVEVVQHDSAVGLRQQLTSDGDDTLNNIRVPSLERDEEAAGGHEEEEEADETEPLLIQSSTMIEMAEAER